MKILYDHQIFNMQEYGGISRYFFELMTGLNYQGHIIKNSIKYSKNVFTSESSIFNSREFLPSHNFERKHFLQTIINKVYAKKCIFEQNFDLFHPTYYDTYFLKNIKKKPFVVTFYDLIHEKLNHQFPIELAASEKFYQNRKILLDTSAKILAISHSTKQDIVELYKIDPNKIVVTHLANSLQFDHQTIANTNGDYILFVGNRQGYKNFASFAKAIANILVKEKHLKLICAGGGAFNEKEQSLLLDLKISDKVIQKPIDDSKLSHLYKNALFFVFPSLYEGFGLPVLEAFECSCPAIISNTSSLSEVGQDAALYIDPTDEDDINDKISILLYDETLRKSLIAKGLTQAKNFSWNKTCLETLEVYKSII